jgi:hypothetical protein
MALQIEITGAFIKSYIKDGKRHPDYNAMNKFYKDLVKHVNSEFPGDEIGRRRPGESEIIKQYREDIWEAVTIKPISKVQAQLMKIRRSTDYAVNYPEQPPRVAEKDSLPEYCEKNLPNHSSITNWAFNVLLPEMMLPNGVVMIGPENDNFEVRQDEFVKPYPYIFHAPDVLDINSDYAVLLSENTCSYVSNNRTYTDGMILYVCEKDKISKLCQSNVEATSFEVYEFYHNLGELPVIQITGIVYKDGKFPLVYKSRIQGMVPFLNEGARTYSDLQSEMMQHVNSQKWQYSTQQCAKCGGSGKIRPDYLSVQAMPKSNAAPINCTSCGGNGVIPVHPYENNIVVNPDTLPPSQANLPIPPAGFVQKTDVADMVKIMKDTVQEHQSSALDIVGMQHLSVIPSDASGVSKAYDNDGANTFMHSFAEDMIKVMDEVYRLIATMRYQYVLDRQTISDMLPTIPVPEQFDILSESAMVDEIAKNRAAKMSGLVIAELEVDYIRKKFYAQPQKTLELQTIHKLDPQPGVSEDDKMARLSNGALTKQDYVISSYITEFVRKAAFEDPNFYGLPMDEQRKVLEKYAEDKMKQNSVKSSIVIPAPPKVPAEPAMPPEN